MEKLWKILLTGLIFGLVREFLGYTPDTQAFYAFLDLCFISSVYVFFEEMEKMFKKEAKHEGFLRS